MPSAPSAPPAADPKASANALSRLSSSSWTTATLPPPVVGFGGAGFGVDFGFDFGFEAPPARRFRRASTAARTPAKAGSPRNAFTALFASSGSRSTASALMPMDRSAASSCESSRLSSSSFNAAFISFDASSTNPSLTQASRISPNATPSRTPRNFSPAVGSALQAASTCASLMVIAAATARNMSSSTSSRSAASWIGVRFLLGRA
mmetsp:Transcript_23454/g.65787  ORF Transcript_23454/g.65787 Transcript_23454/m.65787 type:complete len:206 (+) Transcript_23454:317-934(+)